MLLTRRLSLQWERSILKLILLKEYFSDIRRFSIYSSVLNFPPNITQMEAHIRMDCHRLEKGMSMPKPAPGFGKATVDRLQQKLLDYSNLEFDRELVCTTCQVLRAYDQGQYDSSQLYPETRFLIQRHLNEDSKAIQNSGIDKPELSDIFPIKVEMAEKFLSSRRSVRQFDGKLIEPSKIGKIAEISLRSPSVCNRQSAKLRYTNLRETIDDILSFQNGNRGFGDNVGCLFIVTVDLANFVHVGERNQAFVDGGIFAQQTLLAIHSQHLAGCMLNWSATYAQDKMLRKRIELPASEVVVTLIACGYSIQHPTLAISPRKNVNKVLRQIK